MTITVLAPALFMLWLLPGCAASRAGRETAVSLVPQPGDSMPSGASATGLIHSGRKLCTYWIEISDVKYDFDVKCGETIVVYVQTRDEKFRTPEGISTGQPLRAALAQSKSSLEKIDGRCGVLLSSGWIARPRPEIGENADCVSLREEPIIYFDTRFFDN